MKPMKPGPGWKYVGSACWDHPSGMRLHMGGYLRTATGDFVSANCLPEYSRAWEFIRIAGNNRRRGLMLWALSHAAELTTVST